jgi:hypothetical protein
MNPIRLPDDHFRRLPTNVGKSGLEPDISSSTATYFLRRLEVLDGLKPFPKFPLRAVASGHTYLVPDLGGIKIRIRSCTYRM